MCWIIVSLLAFSDFPFAFRFVLLLSFLFDFISFNGVNERKEKAEKNEKEKEKMCCSLFV